MVLKPSPKKALKTAHPPASKPSSSTHAWGVWVVADRAATEAAAEAKVARAAASKATLAAGALRRDAHKLRMVAQQADRDQAKADKELADWNEADGTTALEQERASSHSWNESLPPQNFVAETPADELPALDESWGEAEAEGYQFLQEALRELP